MQMFELKVDKPKLEPVRCLRCKKVLKKRESIEAKMGDVCRRKAEAEDWGKEQKEG